MEKRSRSTLFLMEQLVVILVFALCAAICVRIFVGSFMMAHDSKDKKNALLLAESIAECYKATSGDIDGLGRILGGDVVIQDGASLLFFDAERRMCAQDMAVYTVRLSERDSETEAASLLLSDLAVFSASGEEILVFTVAARGATG